MKTQQEDNELEAIPIQPGMHLHVIPSDKFMTNSLCVLIRRPLTREEATVNALLPPILSRGSARYPSNTEVALAAERLYGSLFESQIIKKGEQQIIQFYFECVNNKPELLLEGLRFLCEIILCPLAEGDGFKSAYLRGEVENLQNRIEGRINHKSEYAKLKCLEAMCEGEPYGVYGDGYAEDLAQQTPREVFHQYKKVIATSPIDFIAIGRWNEAWLKTQLMSLFSVYRDDIVNIPKAAVKPARAERCTLALKTGAAQGTLCVGLRGDVDPLGDYYVPLQLATEILGGGTDAKLFRNVREKESLCYYINAQLYRFKSLMLIQCGVDAAQFEPVLGMVEEQFNALQQGDISEEELCHAKQSLSKRWKSLQDHPSGCVDFYASQYLLGDRTTIDQMLNKVSSVRREAVVEAVAGFAVDTVVKLS